MNFLTEQDGIPPNGRFHASGRQRSGNRREIKTLEADNSKKN